MKSPDETRPMPLLARIALLFVLGLSVAACAGKPIKSGHLLNQEEIDQIKPGMSKDQVQLTLGTPDTTSTLNGEVFYYISTTRQGPAFMKPKVVDRRVLAVYFNQMSSVDKVAHYGLKDGKVFDFISRTTPSHGGEMNVLQQLLGNFGKKTSVF